MNWLKKILESLKPKHHETNYNSGKTFEEIYNDLGVFSYDEKGFIISYEEFTRAYVWDEITQLNAYKKDLITIDRIEMQIVTGDTYFMISEDLPGWYQFIEKTKEQFSSIPKDWEMKVAQYAFERNFTIIYKK